MSKIIYFASPYSDKDKKVVEERYKVTSLKVAELTSKGNVVISPIVYGHTLLQFHEMPGDWQFWKNFCQSFLYKCEEMIVFKIPGWEESEGVREEIKLANSLGIEISYIEYGT
jgi:hypothetical protein